MISRKCIVTGKILPINQVIKFVLLKDKTIAKEVYGQEKISERHRHR